jgi:tetratricopeptide (TPR) repeat protein
MKKLILVSALSYALSLSAFANIEQGIAAFNKGDLQQATLLITQLDDSDFKKFLYLAKIDLTNGNLEKAEDNIEQALALAPTSGDSHYIEGKVMAALAEDANMFSQMSYVRKVLKAFTAAVKYSPENIQYRQSLLGIHLMLPAMMGGDDDLALAQAKAIESLDALSGSIALLRVYAKLEDQEKFNEVYELTLVNFPDEPAVHFQKGMFYQAQEDFDNAFIEFNKAASLDASTDKKSESKYMAMYQLGRTSVLSKRYFVEGEKALKQYIVEADVSSLMPSKDWAKYRLANIIEFKGDTVKAKILYEEVLKQTTDSDIKSQAKKRVKKLG